MPKKTLTFILISCILFTLSCNGSALAQEWEWSDYALTGDLTLRDVVYANGTYVAVGDGGTIFTSEDAATWNSIEPVTTETLISITYYKGKFYAVGNHGTIVSSENGQDWSVITTGIALSLFAITSGPDKLVTVGWSRNSSQAFAFAAVSEDGVTWTQRKLPALGTGLAGITYGDGLYVAVGWETVYHLSDPVIATSQNALGWDRQNLSITPGSFLNDVAYGNGKYVVARSQNNIILLSEDGSSWQEVVTTNLPDVRPGMQSVTYAEGTEGGLFVIAGPRVLSSPDGQTWTLRRDADSQDPISFGITYGDGKVVTVGQGEWDGTLGAYPAYMMVAPVDLGDPITPGPHCGDGNCDTDEDCSSCPDDCLSSQEVCCSGNNYTGDCCSETDCGTGESCINHECTTLVTECSDNADNDGDSLRDYPADQGCSSPADDDESDCGDRACEGGETCGTTDSPPECTSDCGPCPPPCGNSLTEPGEACDGTDLAGQSCTTLGFDAGTLYCLPDCSDFNTSSCISQTHRADTSPQDGCVEMAELTGFIELWLTSSQGVTMPEMMGAVNLWRQGTGCNQ